MSDVIMRKTILAGRPCLVPVDEEGVEYMARVRNERDVGVKVTQHRNPRHHRLFWKIVKFVQMHAVDENGDSLFEHVDLETLADIIKIKTGYARLLKDMRTGEYSWIAKSISWGAMDQTEFQPFFQRAVDLICGRWMPPGTEEQYVRDELIRLVDGPHALGERVA